MKKKEKKKNQVKIQKNSYRNEKCDLFIYLNNKYLCIMFVYIL